ncbi:hypothetical protein [Amycolatopsis sp. NPDC004079]|uniref:hypothetical protein n=1 Tax=Amycolatopsis sp. NPDC004079 TaxID=3154549 RepID=UPI0033AF7456
MTQPPGTGSLVEQLADLRRQVAELSRKAPAMPACRVALSANVGLPSGDSFAPGVWKALEDPFGWFTAATPSYITVGLDGYYQLTYHSNTTGLAAGAVAASKILRNGAAIASSIATDLRVVPSGTGTEGTVQNCFRARIQLSAGDKIYWNNYTSASGGTLAAMGVAVIPTEMTAQFLSSR